MQPLLITGANGHLGQRLIQALAPVWPLRALVRSPAAAARLRGLVAAGCDVQVVDYLNLEQMTRAVDGCGAAVHLVGIIRESAGSRFETAHVDTTRVLCEALTAAGCGTLIYLSILGAAATSSNPAFATKARAEQLVTGWQGRGIALQIPMVLGEGDFAAAALARRARAPIAVLLRGASLEQPIYAGDVIAAVRAILEDAALPGGVYQLAGPESLPRSALVRRAAAVLGRRALVLSLPLAPVLPLAALLERLPGAPVSRALLGVLDHDDAIDPEPFAKRLGLRLTALDDMLRRVIAGPAADFSE